MKKIKIDSGEGYVEQYVDDKFYRELEEHLRLKIRNNIIDNIELWIRSELAQQTLGQTDGFTHRVIERIGSRIKQINNMQIYDHIREMCG